MHLTTVYINMFRDSHLWTPCWTVNQADVEKDAVIVLAEFPRNELTSISVTGCDDASAACVCSEGRGGLTLTCSAATHPCASYLWKGTDGNIIYSQVHEDIANNGTYHCTAYFDQTLSNYTGSVIFPNGTSVKSVTECCKYRDTFI